MAQIQPMMPTFTLTNVKQIVTQAIWTALAKAQGSLLDCSFGLGSQQGS